MVGLVKDLMDRVYISILLHVFPQRNFTVSWEADKALVVVVDLYEDLDEEEAAEDDNVSLYSFDVWHVSRLEIPLGEIFNGEEQVFDDRWYPCHVPHGNDTWKLFIRVAIGNVEESAVKAIPVQDEFGFDVEPEFYEEWKHTQNLAELRRTDQLQDWRKTEDLWGNLHKRRRSLEFDLPGSLGDYGFEINAEADIKCAREGSGGHSHAEAEKLRTLRSLVWGGVPPIYRERAYLSISGALIKKQNSGAGYYQKLVKQAELPNLGLPGENDWVGCNHGVLQRISCM